MSCAGLACSPQAPPPAQPVEAQALTSSDLLANQPIIEGISFSPSQPQAGDDVRAVLALGYKLPAIQFRYQWLKNGQPVPGVETETFPGAQTAFNDVLKVKVTPFDPSGDKKTITSSAVAIGQKDDRKKFVEGHPCDADSQCASGSCGMADDSMRCIGAAPTTNKDMAASKATLEGLEKETTIGIKPVVPPASPRKSSSRSSSRGSTGWSNTGSSSSGSSYQGLGLGANCSDGGYCGAGLTCKGVSGLATCVPAGR